MSWARAPYVYRTCPVDDFSTPAILCLAGKTMIWCERIEPGESRDYALGNVIATTANVVSKLRPTSQSHPDDHKAAIFEERSARVDETQSASKEAVGKRAIRAQFREFAAASKILFKSIRAREGFLVQIDQSFRQASLCLYSAQQGRILWRLRTCRLRGIGNRFHFLSIVACVDELLTCSMHMAQTRQARG